LEALCAEVIEIAGHARVPVAFQLDHARELADVYPALRHGFSSIMYDASELPFDANVAVTRQVVDLCHGMGVTVEGELGHVGGVEDDVEGGDSVYTDPEQAVRYVAETGVDALAVAIGTAHGIFKETPRLDFDRLKLLCEQVPVPIVIHGGSGLEAETYRRFCRLGARKINIGTEMKIAYMEAVKRFVAAHPDETDPRKLLPEVRGASFEAARAKIRLFAGR
ncbi:MAG TPA: class II fructose-bisphosphate aldolase, partial [Limnochordia bacterium]|nr:class II fructose-bisphosphate aldolase [Limnochordia bacterium]